MFILIPCKSLSTGKSRLSPCLDGAARRSLCVYFLTRTIELAISIAGGDRVRVVTSDVDAITIAARHSVRPLADAPDGLNAALENARNELLREVSRASRLMVLPIDLPYARPQAIARAAEADADVLINSDEHERGTNLLVLPAASEQFRFAFGENSLSAHSRQTCTAGFSLQIVKDSLLARDIDEPEQYVNWMKSAGVRDHLLAMGRLEALAGNISPV
jgi:2-phospho-L-lactate/phosphoenolpyruvate guanylyltransferase